MFLGVHTGYAHIHIYYTSSSSSKGANEWNLSSTHIPFCQKGAFHKKRGLLSIKHGKNDHQKGGFFHFSGFCHSFVILKHVKNMVNYAFLFARASLPTSLKFLNKS